MQNRYLIISCFFLILLITYECNNKIKINDNGWFIDEYNRVKIFRGLNAVRKEAPWLPIQENGHLNLDNDTILENLHKWGFNTIRLGLMWPGLQPEINQINETYLNEIKRLIDRLASKNIYTIIDFHQDFMSTKFNSYDGFPLWFMDLLPKSSLEYPWPFKDKNIGFAAYLTKSCGHAFQALYDNHDNLQKYLINYWTIVAKMFSNHPYVLGYELINEPWAGDIYKHPMYLFPAQTGRHNLLPLYDNLYKNIRLYDNQTIVFYEPVTWGVMSSETFLFGTGFNRAPGYDPLKTSLAWHHYCWLLQFNTNPLVNDKLPQFSRILCDDIQKVSTFNSIRKNKKLIGTASFLTEFGVCAFGKVNSSGLNTRECEDILNAADKYLESWTYWDSDFYTYDFEINEELVNIFSRVYPMSTSGTPKSLNFNTKTKLFIYKFSLDHLIKQPSEIFIPKHVYPNGFYVRVSRNLDWSFSNQSQILNLYGKPIGSNEAFIRLYPIN